jgi:uncharacterized protein
VTTHLRTLLWNERSEPSFEYFSLSEREEGYLLSGSVVMSLDRRPVSIRYQIVANYDWYTQHVDIVMKMGREERQLQLHVDADQRWWQGNEEIVACRGAFDVDLSFSPATNTLAMRRFALEVGESKMTTTAWVQLPDLKVEPFPQQYSRLSRDEYLFTSLKDDFKAKLIVDDLGLVMDYEDLWVAIAQGE